jgi:hypothetical protein
MKNPYSAVDDTEQGGLPLSMNERAKKARHETYVLAKERRKNDPRTIQFKEKMKARRREANAEAKERRKNYPTQIAFKAKLKKNRQEVNKRAQEDRKARAEATTKAERASKDARLKASFGALITPPGK